ncbi:Type I site-specific deoxyribonuclease [Bordetella sputigena]|uniref:P-loop NTPase fold protein n=1 Tax=Bordetella sputigena TaxID=1416810 RepID=UPI0039EF061F
MDAIESILSACRNLKLADANEAATRLKVVDRVLREVLGWSDSDINPEEHVSEDGNSTFADYVLTTANVGVVVETKKIGAAFSIPMLRRKERLNKSFVVGALGEAIIQARDYCRGLGIDFAVVTNGDAWIIFPAQRHDRMSFQDSYALVFPTLLSALSDDFQEFHELLARDSVINGSLETALIGRQENQLSARTLGNLLGSSGHTPRRNTIYPLIQPGIELAFSDAISELDGDLLEKSYVSTPERIRFDQHIGMHLARKASLFSAQPPRPMKTGEQSAMVDKLASSLKRSRPLAVIVLGSVGTGKTTFLDYTRKVKASKFFEERKGGPYPHWIYVDFRAFTQGDSPKQFIFERLFDYVKSNSFLSDFHQGIEPAYRSEIEALKRGPLFLYTSNEEKLKEKIVELIANDYSAVHPYVEKLVRNAAKNTPVFLVVDNIDQVEVDQLESQLFADVLALGQLLQVNVVISMRDSTYAKYRSAPVFDAYDFDPIQIDVPKISSVLSKRFQLAKFLLAGHSGEFIAENGARVTVDDSTVFVDIVQSSVLGTEVGRMIEVLANEDVRLALRMTRQFLETGYTNPGRALEHYKTNRRYTLPRHEALRAILQGGASVYKEALSTIGNPFDARLGRTEAQMLRVYILSALVNMASLPSFRYAEVQSILESLRRIGFGTELSMRAVRDICVFRFAFNVSHTDVSEYSSLMPSRLGGYVVRDLITDFVFQEAMMMDTFIADDAVWDSLRQLTQEIEQERDTVRRIELRIARVQAFFILLHGMTEQLTTEATRRGLPKEWCMNPFVVTDMERELQTVLASAKRNYGGS